MKLIYDEYYGEISVAQRNAYRKYNVSQSDHDFLVDEFGEDQHQLITQAVKDRSPDGMFNAFHNVSLVAPIFR